VSAVNAHALTQVGLVVAGLGALSFVWGAAIMVAANRSYHGPTDSQHRNEKMAHLIGSILLAVGFVIQLVALVAR